ncbi:MAG: reprolysin-like metallopeptidase [Verrucomicrobiota bacterium]
MWRVVDQRLVDPAAKRLIVPMAYVKVRVDKAVLAQALAGAPMEFTKAATENPSTIHLPMPDGTMARFRFEESPVIEPGLAAKFPGLKTYRAQGIDDPAATSRFDWLPTGFHAIILAPSGTVLIDPYAKGNTTDYITYWKKDAANAAEPFECHFIDPELPPLPAGGVHAPGVTSGTILRTYRLALAATNEYTVAVGNNTIAGALAAEVLVMNRVNGVYERDLAIHMNLVANNDLITYAGDNFSCGGACSSGNDPYSNNDNGSMLGQNQTNLDNVIGSANYDIGHVFGTTTGGVAYGSVSCTSNKALGVTGFSDPVGDPFAIDYVAHEMGHQWGALHTFNGAVGSCGGSNRTDSAAYEPGSGITIMAYAGICGNQNLAAHSIDTFHLKSIEQIVAYSQTGNGNNCAAATPTGNTAPTVGGPGNFTIPKGTPFSLAASATDPNGDSITYDWEEYDLGASTSAAPNTDSDGNARPIFRPYLPTTGGTRTFPSLQYILNNANVPPPTTGGFLTGELLPAISRVMMFQVVARDNRAGGGGINTATSIVTIDGAAPPFAVTAPNTGISVPVMTNLNVTWSASGSAANVKISLSTDGGNTFPTVLAASTPNDGAESVLIPNLPTTMARIKIEAVGNIYFDISDTDFSITTAAPLGLVTAVSRKNHGGAGSFGINMPLTGQPGVECRTGGGNHTLVIAFNNDVVSGDATITGGTASLAGPPAFSANTMTINLTGVANAQTVTITLRNVTDTSGQTFPDTAVSASFLVGDTNGSGSVNASDVSQTKSQAGQPISDSNFRSDVNANGAINASDTAMIKGNLGSALP